MGRDLEKISILPFVNSGMKRSYSKFLDYSWDLIHLGLELIQIRYQELPDPWKKGILTWHGNPSWKLPIELDKIKVSLVSGREVCTLMGSQWRILTLSLSFFLCVCFLLRDGRWGQSRNPAIRPFLCLWKLYCLFHTKGPALHIQIWSVCQDLRNVDILRNLTEESKILSY